MLSKLEDISGDLAHGYSNVSIFRGTATNVGPFILLVCVEVNNLFSKLNFAPSHGSTLGNGATSEAGRQS